VLTVAVLKNGATVSSNLDNNFSGGIGIPKVLSVFASISFRPEVPVIFAMAIF